MSPPAPFRHDVSVEVIGSALLGCAEGMMRDRIIAERAGKGSGYEEGGIYKTFEAVVGALGR